MTTNNIYKYLVAAGLTAMVVSSCRDDFDYESHYVNTAVQNYEKNFIDMFGSVDPDHTWNTASQRSMNVAINYPGEFTARIYTSMPVAGNNSFLLGEFSELEGGTVHNLQFDAPSDIEHVYVGLEFPQGGYLYEKVEIEKEGAAEVKFGEGGMTRAGHYGNSGSWTVSSSNDYFRVGKNAEVAGNTYQEMTESLAVLPENTNNHNKATENFQLISKGSVTIYPMYWNTTQSDVIGVYYKDENNNVITTEVYTVKSGNELQYITSKAIFEKCTNGSHLGTIGSYCSTTDHKRVSAISGSSSKTYYHDKEVTDTQWTNVTSNLSSTNLLKNLSSLTSSDVSSTNSGPYQRSKGITIDIPEGTVFGMYLKNGSNQYSYTESELNTSKKNLAATFIYDDHMYLSFEDNANDNDLNDVIVVFKDETAPIVVQMGIPVAETVEYLVAYEDLGNTDDLDFNDVVISVKHASGQITADIKLLAAGGTLPTQVKYIEKPVGRTEVVLFNEVHAAFGVPLKEMVNTGEKNSATKVTRTAKSVSNGGVQKNYIEYNNLLVGRDFSIATGARNFVIVVVNDGEKSTSISVPDLEAGDNIIPQAILISDPNWCWPTERTFIANAYNNFDKWVKNAKMTKWYDAVWDGAPNTSSGSATIEDERLVLPYADPASKGYFQFWTLAENEYISAQEVTIDLKDYESSGVQIAVAIVGREAGEVVSLETSGTFSSSTDLTNVDIDPNGDMVLFTIDAYAIKTNSKLTLRIGGDNYTTSRFAAINTIWTKEKDRIVSVQTSVSKTVTSGYEQGSIDISSLFGSKISEFFGVPLSTIKNNISISTVNTRDDEINKKLMTSYAWGIVQNSDILDVDFGGTANDGFYLQENGNTGSWNDNDPIYVEWKDSTDKLKMVYGVHAGHYTPDYFKGKSYVIKPALVHIDSVTGIRYVFTFEITMNF